MFCGQCGSHIAQGSICCPVCGRQVAAVGFSKAIDLEAPQPPTVQTPPPAEEITTRLANFCGCCGAPVEADRNVCMNCGRPIGAQLEPSAIPTVAEKPAKPPKKKSKAPMFILLSLALLLVAGAVALALYLLMGNQTPENAAKDYVKAALEPDAKAVMGMLPGNVSADVLKAADGTDLASFCSQKTGEMDQTLDSLDLIWGPGWTYSIESAEAMEYYEEEMDRICREYTQKYDVTVEEAAVVYVDVRFKGQLRSETQTKTVYLIQVNNQWYLDYLAKPDLFHS